MKRLIEFYLGFVVSTVAVVSFLLIMIIVFLVVWGFINLFGGL